MKKKVLNEILVMQKKLRPLTEPQIRWAHSHYSEVAYYNSRHTLWCQCCGYQESSTPGAIRLDAELGGYCPQCSKGISVERKIGKSFTEEKMITYATHIAGWQVFRTYLASRYNLRGRPTVYSLNEVYQHWIDVDGNEYILSKGYTRSQFVGMRWKFNTPLSHPRRHNASSGGAYYLPDVFDVAGNYVYPRSTFHPLLRRNGWSNSFLENTWTSAVEVCKALYSSAMMETLAKTQPKLFLWVVRYKVSEFFFAAVKICNRNGYIINDPDLWLDYMRDLIKLGRDIHNRHYVCPEDVAEAHERTQQMLLRRHEKEEEALRRERIAEEEEAYSTHITPYAGIVLHGEAFDVRPLLSVSEVYEEGEKMKHCVYTNGYYKKKDSLLLSARRGDERVETVELSLKTFEVLQSRAVRNGVTPWHERIIQLINNNANRFKDARDKAACA